MYQRYIQAEIQQVAAQYPILSLRGPRQSGKTTLVKAMFADKPYVSLENIDERGFAERDPRGFLAQFPDGAVIDEVQHVPSLLSYLQTIVDEDKRNGLFILTGSHQLLLHQAVSQSLAGRVALLDLLPLSMSELRQAGFQLDIDEQMYRGCYPRIYSEQLHPSKAYHNYIQTYLEKDIRSLSNIKDLVQFQNFMKLCAGRIGQVVDYTALGNDLGLSGPTIKHWLSILEASYIVLRLPPYFENFGKRVIKSPKLYFTDLGLACALLDIETPKQLARDPLRGYLVENLVILELYKYRYNRGLTPNCYFYRDSRQNEVDVIIKQAHQLIPIEIKAAVTFQPRLAKNLLQYHKLVGDRIATSYLVYTGQQEYLYQNIQLLNYRNIERVYAQT